MAGHLFVLEDAAGILALTGRTERAVRDRNAVGGAHAAEAPALHAAGETLALRYALDVDHLAGDIMAGGDFSSDVEERALGDTELGHAPLRLHLALAKLPPLRLAEDLGLARAAP